MNHRFRISINITAENHSVWCLHNVNNHKQVLCQAVRVSDTCTSLRAASPNGSPLLWELQCHVSPYQHICSHCGETTVTGGPWSPPLRLHTFTCGCLFIALTAHYCLGEIPCNVPGESSLGRVVMPWGSLWKHHSAAVALCLHCSLTCCPSWCYIFVTWLFWIKSSLDYVTRPGKHTGKNNQVALWHLKSPCKMYLLLLPSSCMFPHFHYWKCCKTNSALSHNHLHDVQLHHKEVWLPLLPVKDRHASREHNLLSWTLDMMNYTLKVSFCVLRSWTKFRGIAKPCKYLVFRLT